MPEVFHIEYLGDGPGQAGEITRRFEYGEPYRFRRGEVTKVTDPKLARLLLSEKGFRDAKVKAPKPDADDGKE